MKVLRILALAVTTGLCIAADPTWNSADAAKEGEQDIRSGHKYPRADAGVGCVTNDIPLRERQEEYARRYNEKIYAYVTQKH